MTFENEMRESKAEDEGVYIPLVKFEQLIHAADGYRTALRGLRWLLEKEYPRNEEVQVVLALLGESRGQSKGKKEKRKGKRSRRERV